ncbi:alpha-aspartyl dipeptidase [Gadus morhua]|uniref:Alpha-aspartyl dipeptidase n=1 Tax=Gadus morhua TaxID=8049 RepID=A0A8C5C2Q4_GADMO|nr:alpha-aspartyl dipeptidase-like [Gadus morhua]
MEKRRLLLVSNSTLHGGGYLDHCQAHISTFFGRLKRVLFVPYALHDRDGYACLARTKFNSLGYELDSIHDAEDPREAVRTAEAIFIGGGNTFRLLKCLYDNQLLADIRRRVLEDGIPYMGSSAGTNVSTISISTTTHPRSTHMGETREQRILQYHEEPDTPPVLALREGCVLMVEGNQATLLGGSEARLFTRGKPTVEYNTGSDLSFLLTDEHQPIRDLVSASFGR